MIAFIFVLKNICCTRSNVDKSESNIVFLFPLLIIHKLHKTIYKETETSTVLIVSLTLLLKTE